MRKCEYGCGQEALFQFKNRRWCCSENANFCPAIRKKNSETNLLVQNKSEIRLKKSFAAKIANSKPEVKAKISDAMKVANSKPETRRKKSVAMKGKNSGFNCYAWRGGLTGWWHVKAKELFGKPFCEECKISLEEHKLKFQKYKNFDMHCISKDYTILEQWNWRCLCRKCHWKTFDRKGGAR